MSPKLFYVGLNDAASKPVQQKPTPNFYSYFYTVILVTGSTGIVGSRIVFDLLKSGESVRALKRVDSDIEFIKRIFQFYDPENGLALWESINWFDGDILDILSLTEAFEGIDKVYHTAALVSYHPSDAEKLIDVNGNGTANVVNAALASKVKKLCHISSVAALGQARNGEPTTETDEWERETNTSVYGLSKFTAEREVWRGTAEGLPAVIVNPSIIFGPAKANQSSGMLMNLLQKGSLFYPPGTGGYVDVRDVSAIAIALMNSAIENKRYLLNSENLLFRDLLDLSSEIFGGKKPKYKVPFPILSTARIFLKFQEVLTGKKAAITPETAKSSFRKNQYSAEKIKKELGISFFSIRETLANYRDFFHS